MSDEAAGAQRSWLVLVGLLLIVLLGMMLWPRRDEQPPAPPPLPTLTPRATVTATPEPTVTPSPVPTTRIETSRVVLPWPDATVTPTQAPTPTATAVPSRPQTSCVSLRWRVHNSPVAFGQVNVEVEAANHCGRRLEPLEVWFRVTAWQGGKTIYVRDGHPFDAVDPGYPVTSVIVVPGDVSIYDRIDVEVTKPR